MPIFTLPGFFMLGYFGDIFFQYLRFEKQASPHTIVAYKNDLDQLFVYLGEQYGIDDARLILPIHLRSWLVSLQAAGLQAKSINRKRAAAKSFFKYLIAQGLISANPCRTLPALKVPDTLPQFIKEKEADKLFDNVQFDEGFKGSNDRLVLSLLYQAGLRRSELVGLKLSDVAWGTSQLRVIGKGDKERFMPLSSALLHQIEQYLTLRSLVAPAAEGALFVTEKGRAITGDQVARIVRKYLSVVTSIKKKSPHVLRHSFATHLLENGASIQAIRMLLGHSSLSSTQIYTHVGISQLKDIHKRTHPKG